MNKKKYLTFIISIFLFSIPIFLFGIKDREDYDLGFFTSKIIFSNLNLFIFYFDLYGPGVKFPIGQGIFFHPFLALIFNTKLFYFVLVSSYLFIQINFLNKILKQFKIYNKSTIPLILLIFSISNFNYVYSDDWISNFTSYTFLFVSFYYLNKILSKFSNLSFIQFIISVSFMILNGHVGVIYIYILFFIFYVIINKRFDLFTKKETYFYLTIITLVLSEFLYWLIQDYLSYETSFKQIQKPYNLNNFFHSLISPFFYFPVVGKKLLNIFDINIQINRLPFYGISVFISLFYSFYLILKKKSSEINYLNYLLIIFIILCLTDLSKIFYVIPAIWQLRDILNVISIILISKLFNEIRLNNKIIYFLKFLFLFTIFIFYLGNILIFTNANLKIKNYLFNLNPSLSNILFHKSNLKIQSVNNFIVDKVEDEQFLNILDSLILDKEIYSRIYIGQNFYDLLTDKKSPLRKYGIYGPTDFLKFNLINFNITLKNSSLEIFNKSSRKMYSSNPPFLNDMNSKLFFKYI